MTLTLAHIRSLATYCVAGLAFALGLTVAIAEWVFQGGMGGGGLISLAGCALLACAFAIARNSASTRYLAVAVLMGEIVALLIAARGHVWQTDIHMLFFAALAISAMMYDVKALLLGTALVAVHHLVLGLGLEELVFYGEGGLTRIGFHAVVLVIEAVGLVWMTVAVHRLLDLSARKTSEADQAAQEAQTLSRQVTINQEQNAADRAAMIAALQQAFGNVVDRAANGDFSQRIDASFPDQEINRLANGVNNLITTVDAGLSETSAVLAHIARAQLGERVMGQYRGAFGSLKDDTNTVAERLSDIIGQLQQTSRTLKTATVEILSGANDLADRTTRQAATIEETSSTMEQLAQVVIDNAEMADSASRAASVVSAAAEEGGKVMSRANDAMGRINQSSEKISDIIGMIDDIAFQTNLLALNASVEAARAGEAGKGFAVVAVEVRRLAQSAAEASADVKSLIEQSSIEVRAGSELVADAATKLASVLEGIRNNSSGLGSIATACREQALSIADVTRAVRQLDEMTQHNAALVEEMNAAIEQTEGQAGELDRIADIFSLRAPASAAATGTIAPVLIDRLAG